MSRSGRTYSVRNMVNSSHRSADMLLILVPVKVLDNTKYKRGFITKHALLLSIWPLTFCLFYENVLLFLIGNLTSLVG